VVALKGLEVAATHDAGFERQVWMKGEPDDEGGLTRKDDGEEGAGVDVHFNKCLEKMLNCCRSLGPKPIGRVSCGLMASYGGKIPHRFQHRLIWDSARLLTFC
jgi:hypothetical protein